MKKITFFVIASLITISVFSQEKNNISGNSYKCNIGYYQGTSNEENSKKDTAACAIIKLHFDYSVIKNLAIGFSFERNGFFTNKDSSDKASSLNLGLSFKIKFISREFNSLYLDIMPAYSYFTYQKETNNQIDKIKSNGYNFQVGLGWDHYFGDHLGMYLGTYYTLYRYSEIIDASNDEILQVNYPQEDFKVTFSGMNFLKLGLLYRF